ncbi:uncharacterized protein LOC144458424 [Epinephelus lanceolatus]
MTSVAWMDAQTYLDTLKGIAKLSGKEFEEVLKEVMSQIGSPEQATEPSQHEIPPQLSANAPSPIKLGLPDQSTAFAPSPRSKTSLTLSSNELNPPEVQKIAVEHIVRSEDRPTHSHPTLKLRAFSGKPPRPYSEAEYDSWRSHVDLMMKDVSISDLENTRKILESLLAPASDVIRHLSPEAPPTAYLQMFCILLPAVSLMQILP